MLVMVVVSIRKDREQSRGDELIEAAWYGNTGRVNELIGEGADVNFNLTAHPSCIPLTCAASEGHTGIVQILLDNHADINATDDSHMTALQHATERGHADIVRLLKQAGAK